MPSTYSDLKFELIALGEQAGTWGTTTNNNIGTAIQQAIAGKADISFSSATETLTLINSNTAQDARALYLSLTGSPGGAGTLEVPAIEKAYIVYNNTGETVTVKVSGQTGVEVPDGATAWLYNNGTDVTRAIDYLPSLTLGSPLPVAQGGTGVTTSTGTGAVVLDQSPTLATPTLTTPDLTNPTLSNTTEVDGPVQSNIVAVPALDMDCSAGNYFTKSLTADAQTITASNVPASGLFAFILALDIDPAVSSLTFDLGGTIEWPNGSAPNASAGFTTLYIFITDDGGTTFRGSGLTNFDSP